MVVAGEQIYHSISKEKFLVSHFHPFIGNKNEIFYQRYKARIKGGLFRERRADRNRVYMRLKFLLCHESKCITWENNTGNPNPTNPNTWEKKTKTSRQEYRTFQGSFEIGLSFCCSWPRQNNRSQHKMRPFWHFSVRKNWLSLQLHYHKHCSQHWMSMSAVKCFYCIRKAFPMCHFNLDSLPDPHLYYINRFSKIVTVILLKMYVDNHTKR